MPATTVEGKVTVIESSPLKKAEEDLLRSKRIEGEDGDVFQSVTTADGRGADVIVPRYLPLNLHLLAMENNALMQCIEAMEVNIDGTGYTVERKDGKPVTEEDETAVNEIRDFFDHLSPDGSFTNVRRKVRRDLEITGNGYIEVLRDRSGEIIFMNHLESCITRITRKDDPILVEETITRRGMKRPLKRYTTERRYAQVIRDKLMYFKEFGSVRKLHSKLGCWEGDVKLRTTDNPEGLISDEDSASEVIHLVLHKDPMLPYGVPRWIPQTPSILGSREAEEYNLMFFRHGGLPPALIFVQGGSMSEPNRKALSSYLGARAKNKQRGAIVELYSTSGEIGGGGTNVKVAVERFGAERQQDGMFLNYDQRCKEHVRGAFRLPSLFLGEISDVTFSSAYVAHIVTEAQVFQPERAEFDEFINMRIMPELNDEYVIRSNPVGVSDIQQQLMALGLGETYSDPFSFVENLNQTANLNLKVKEDIDEQMLMQEIEDQISNGMLSRSTNGGASNDNNNNTMKSVVRITTSDDGLIAKMDDQFMRDLVNDWCGHLSGTRSLDEESLVTIKNVINIMDTDVKKQFDTEVGERIAHVSDVDKAQSVYHLIGLATSINEKSNVMKKRKQIRRLAEATKPKNKKGSKRRSGKSIPSRKK